MKKFIKNLLGNKMLSSLSKNRTLLIELSILLLFFTAFAVHTEVISSIHHQPGLRDNVVIPLLAYKKMTSLGKFTNKFTESYWGGGSILNSEYPPLYLLEKIPFYALFGANRHIAVLADLVWMFLAMLFTYLCGRRMHSGFAGLLAALVLLLSPTVAALMRAVEEESAMLALVPVALYVLLMSEEMQNRRWSIIFGLAVGLGLLTKWNFSLYLIAPFVVAVLRACRRKKRIPVANLCIALAFMLLLAGPWYLRNSDLIVKCAVTKLDIEMSGDQGNPLTNYPQREARLYLFPWLLWLFPIAALWLPLARPRYWGEILTGMVFPYLFFSFKVGMTLKFLQPNYPFYALALGLWVASLGRFMRRLLASAVIFLFLIQYILLACGVGNYFTIEGGGYLVPNQELYGGDEILSLLNSILESSEKPVRILIVRHSDWSSYWLMFNRMTGSLSENFKIIQDITGETEVGMPPISVNEREQLFSEAQIIMGNLDPEVRPTYLPSTLDECLTLVDVHRDRFVKVLELTFEDPDKKNCELVILAEPQLVQEMDIPQTYHCTSQCERVD